MFPASFLQPVRWRIVFLLRYCGQSRRAIAAFPGEGRNEQDHRRNAGCSAARPNLGLEVVHISVALAGLRSGCREAFSFFFFFFLHEISDFDVVEEAVV